MANYAPAKYVTAKRNKGKLLQNNFLYKLNKKSGNKSFWICNKKSASGCKVAATVLMKVDEDDEREIIVERKKVPRLLI